MPRRQNSLRFSKTIFAIAKYRSIVYGIFSHSCAVRVKKATTYLDHAHTEILRGHLVMTPPLIHTPAPLQSAGQSLERLNIARSISVNLSSFSLPKKAKGHSTLIQ